MSVIGIVAEYDPFHNGHAWQLAEAKHAVISYSSNYISAVG